MIGVVVFSVVIRGEIRSSLFSLSPVICAKMGVQWSEWLCFLLSFVEKFAVHCLVCLLWYVPKCFQVFNHAFGDSLLFEFLPLFRWICLVGCCTVSGLRWIIIFFRKLWQSVSAVSNCANVSQAFSEVSVHTAVYSILLLSLFGWMSCRYIVLPCNLWGFLLLPLIFCAGSICWGREVLPIIGWLDRSRMILNAEVRSTCALSKAW